jgi:Arc/MetJ family transcription regulator
MHRATWRISGLPSLGYTHSVSKRLVDIDDELLDEASSVLGASTMKEAVNRSLEAVVIAARRRRHAERLATMQGLDLDKPKVMSGAWR